MPESLRENGVVGAGGAGFPAYVKASSKAEILIVNAAECEPLLRKDQAILSLYPEKVFSGIKKMMGFISAGRAVIGIKGKHGETVRRLKKMAASENGIEVFELMDYYPAGDEFCLVYDITGRIIPMGGLPPDVGVVVSNVETLLNVASDAPVTEKFVSVTGHVGKPFVSSVPVGTRFEVLLEAAEPLSDRIAVLDGGPMMGKFVRDFSSPVTKTTSGLVVLPLSHPLVLKKTRFESGSVRIGRSACDQCSYCTELCPRYLLGHSISPHKVMRSLLFSPSAGKVESKRALPCCECSLCSLYSCPENLDPSRICSISKRNLAEKGIKAANSGLDCKSSPEVHPLREDRKTPVKKLIRKLALSEYDGMAPFLEFNKPVQNVKIMLKQHIGAGAVPVVDEGDSVARGDVVGRPPEGKLGACVHASISGVVVKVNKECVEIENE